MDKVRTRFAPSPTGYLHVGGIRTALFAWIVAKQAGGDFILRIEDTDKAREVEGSDEHIIKSLKALGLDYNEGPDIDGPYGPYKQSLRLDIYKEWANKLVESGRAYADPFTEVEVNDFRAQAKLNKKPFLFRDYRPENPPKWDGTKPLRFKSDPKNYTWHDEVMGDLSSGPEVIDDFIIIKSDGYPTYNFSHIIDDYLMEISHVIRSQEFLASMPKYLNLYGALDFKLPIFATTPPVLGPDGKKKLSKRDGAKDVLEYLEDGYLVETLDNFIASLGWNDGTEQEIFSIQELISKFRLSGVQKSGAHFDDQRLIWMNGVHIRNLNLDDLYAKTLGFWPKSASSYDDEYKKGVLGLIKDRLKFFSEIPVLTNFFFEDLPLDGSLIENNKQLSKIDHGQLKSWLEQGRQQLEESDFSVDDLSQRLNQLLITTEQKPGILFSLIRIATTQSPASPGLFDTLSLIGKDRSLQRIDQQLQAL
ncbi:MAG TPA: glutamate--tRNA ligase [Candidatus Saccharimonadales bacterium]